MWPCSASYHTTHGSFVYLAWLTSREQPRPLRAPLIARESLRGQAVGTAFVRSALQQPASCKYDSRKPHPQPTPRTPLCAGCGTGTLYLRTCARSDFAHAASCTGARDPMGGSGTALLCEFYFARRLVYRLRSVLPFPAGVHWCVSHTCLHRCVPSPLLV